MVGFTPVEEVEGTLVVLKDLAEKEVRDFFREEWVEDPSNIILLGDLVVVVVRSVIRQVAAVEGTLVEAAEIMKKTPVGEVEDLITSEQISKTNAVIAQPAMVM